MSDPPEGIAMTAMAVDVAPGGGNKQVIVYRYGGWVAPIISTKEEDWDGHRVASRVVQHRRDGCPVVVDLGGGWGGDATVAMTLCRSTASPRQVRHRGTGNIGS